MFDCRTNRLDYGELLQPPSGYEMDHAIGTTYSIDLPTVISIPIAMVYAQTLEGDIADSGFRLLESVRRFSERTLIFHQEGRLHVPPKANWLYAYIESTLVPVRMESWASVFHPKVWILRFVAEEDRDNVLYRVIVASRNLTFDRSWDVATAMDGVPGRRNVHETTPLAEFAQWLVAKSARVWTDRFIADLKRVQFSKPGWQFDSMFFHPIGISGHARNPISEIKTRNALVVSPFLDQKTVQSLRKRTDQRFELISDRAALDSLSGTTLTGVSAYHLSDIVADSESAEETTEATQDTQRQNLHAKLFLFWDAEKRGRTTVFLGSANATEAANSRNVEFAVQLQCAMSKLRSDDVRKQFFGDDDTPGPFVPYTRSEMPAADNQEDDNRLRRFEYQLLRAPKTASVTPSENGETYDFSLDIDLSKMHGIEGFDVTVCPFTAAPSSAPFPLQIGERLRCRFPGINELDLTRFFLFRVQFEKKGVREFLQLLDVTGLPPERLRNILRKIIDNRDKFFQYLRFLLEEDVSKEDILLMAEPALRSPARELGEKTSSARFVLPIFEQLLVTASRNPDRLKDVDRVVKDLIEADGIREGSAVVPDEFREFWSVFQEEIP